MNKSIEVLLIDNIIEKLNLGSYINLYHYYWYYKARNLSNEIDLCDRLIVLSKSGSNYNIDFTYNDEDIEYFYQFLLVLFDNKKEFLDLNSVHYLNKTYYSFSFNEDKLRSWLNFIQLDDFNIEDYIPKLINLDEISELIV